MTIAAGITAAGKAEAKAIQKALWGVKVKGVNGNISFIKQGPPARRAPRTFRTSTLSPSRAARSRCHNAVTSVAADESRPALT